MYSPDARDLLSASTCLNALQYQRANVRKIQDLARAYACRVAAVRAFGFPRDLKIRPRGIEYLLEGGSPGQAQPRAVLLLVGSAECHDHEQRLANSAGKRDGAIAGLHHLIVAFSLQTLRGI